METSVIALARHLLVRVMAVCVTAKVVDGDDDDVMR